jgi:long-chain acyl-CoA synthetase
MMGYYHNPEATDAIVKLHKDGCRWLHTGDLGYMDENGVLFVTGRIKRILMTKGRDGNMTKLFPDRIEKVIGQHPAVAVNCAIGVPDPERVHIPVAYIVPNEDRADCERIEKELRELCKTQLPEYMWPDRFVFVDELPRTSRGKIDYRALEERAVKEA